MRQAGLKPKSHNSGIYWIRQHSGTKTQGCILNGFLLLLFICIFPVALIVELIKKQS